MWKYIVIALSLLLWAPSLAPAETQTITKTLLVNTSGTDFTIAPSVAAQQIYITSIAMQNAGFTYPVNVKLCDGPCASATQVLGPFLLSPGVLGKAGGQMWGPDACAVKPCIVNMTTGNALIAQADTGQINNVTIMITYYYFFPGSGG